MARNCKSARGYCDELNRALGALDCDAIESFVEILFQAWQQGRKVFVCGNGGSASTASHHVLDLVKTAAVEGQPRLKAIGLADNYGITTAVGNDISFDDSFQFPLSAYADSGDILVAISCSGNSPNIVRACAWARAHDLTVVGLTGFSGGKLRELSHLEIHVPSDNYGVVEDLHLSVGHMGAQLLKARIQNQMMAVV